LKPVNIPIFFIFQILGKTVGFWGWIWGEGGGYGWEGEGGMTRSSKSGGKSIKNVGATATNLINKKRRNWGRGGEMGTIREWLPGRVREKKCSVERDTWRGMGPFKHFRHKQVPLGGGGGGQNTDNLRYIYLFSRGGEDI